jgi:hypothetical protein
MRRDAHRAEHHGTMGQEIDVWHPQTETDKNQQTSRSKDGPFPTGSEAAWHHPYLDVRLSTPTLGQSSCCFKLPGLGSFCEISLRKFIQDPQWRSETTAGLSPEYTRVFLYASTYDKV